MNPNNQAYYSSNPGPGKGKRILIVVGLFILVAAAIGYFVRSGQSNSGGNSNTTNTPTDEADKAKILPLSALSSPKLVAPDDMDDYIQRKDFVADVGDYTTKNNGCNLQFGVVSSIDLPGATLQEIASRHIGAGEETGAVGGEPEVGKDMVLYDTEGKQRYSMPVLEYAFSRDGVNYRARYAVIILAKNIRAYVRTYCASSGNTVADADFRKINDTAKKVRVETE